MTDQTLFRAPDRAAAEPSTPGTPRLLLALGAAAGPLYVGAGLAEALTRRGFSLAHHDLSLLSNGPWGWLHSTLLLVTGLLVLVGAVGIRRAGVGSMWGPRLLMVYGAGLCGAGAFRADPMSGFPPGTTAGRPAHVSWHGNLHFLTGAVAFLALIAACAVFSRWYGRVGRRRESRWTLVTGVLFTAAFVGIATGSSSAVVVIAFELAVVVSFTWLTVLSLSLRGKLR